MKNKNNSKNKFNFSTMAFITYMVMIICMIIITCFLSNSFYTDPKIKQEKLNYQSKIITDITWYDENDNIVSNTQDLYSLGSKNKIYCIIPNNINMGDSLYFRAEHIYLAAYIDDICIYSLKNEDLINNKLYTKSIGSHWITIPINPNNIGKKLYIQYELAYNETGCGISQCAIGPGRNLALNFVSSKFWDFQLSFVYFIIGLILILLDILIDNKLKQHHRLLYLGLIAITVSIYCMVETHLIHMFISNKRLVHIISIFTLNIIPMSFILFANSLYEFKHKSAVFIMSIISFLSFIVNSILNYFDIFDYRESLISTHFMILLTIIVMFYSIIKYILKYYMTKYERNIYIIFMIIGTIVITICGLIDLIRFYTIPSEDAVVFLRLGFLIFIICYSFSCSGKIIDTFELSAKVEVMSKLAYEDNLTGLRNRTSYNEKLETYRKQGVDFGIVMLDVNNLKLVNDTFGHDDGDAMLITSASIIQKIFCKPGMVCYRIGGDEFVVLVKTDNIRLDCISGMHELELSCIAHNKITSDPYKIIIASGFAEYKHNITESIEYAVNKADELMYAKKKELKKIQATY